jgi:signal transduction histidine kinase
VERTLSQDGQTAAALAQASVRWMTMLMPDARVVILTLQPGTRARVVVADAALIAHAADFELDAESPLRSALTSDKIVHSPLYTNLQRQLPWSAELGHQRTRVASLAVPQVAPHTLITVFHGPESARVVEAALASLAVLLDNAIPTSIDANNQRSISRAKREWERTVDTLDAVVLLVDAQSRILRANRAIERWQLGTVSGVRGTSVHSVLHGDCHEPTCRLARLLSHQWKRPRTPHPSSFELFEERLAKNVEVTFHSTLPDSAEDDDLDASVGVFVIEDVTELHKTQRKLQQLNDGLEMRVKNRTAQLQASNHDLREQMTRRKIVEQELQTSRDELARLSEQLLKSQESERRRIALELHDSIGQSLGALKYSLERVIAIRNEPELGDAGEALDAAVRQLQCAINDTRSISMNLRPSLLDDMGAASAVKWFCRQVDQTFIDIDVITECSAKDADVPERLAAPIFRIVQEALNNVVKHAAARHALVSLSRRGTALTVEIRDDGVGFDAEAKSNVQRLGIVGMRERVAMTGGSFAVESGTGIGTRIRATWALTE